MLRRRTLQQRVADLTRENDELKIKNAELESKQAKNEGDTVYIAMMTGVELEQEEEVPSDEE